MAILSGLCCLALKPLIVEPLVETAGDAAGRVMEFLYRRIRDESADLFAALRSANERAWQSLEVALAGESFWSFLSDKTDQSFREQVRLFLDRVPLPVAVADQADFRKQCVADIQRARQAGLLAGDVDAAALSRDVGAFARFNHPEAIVAHRNRLAADLAREIRARGCESLAYLLGAVDVEESILVHALRYFFRRELDRRPRLAQFMEEMRWQHLETGLSAGFRALADVLEQQGPLLTKLLAEAAALRAEARAHYLDLKEELHRLDDRQAQANRELYQNILQALEDNYRQLDREVRFSDSLSLRSETEYHFVKALVAQYRGLPEDQRRRLPALMHAVGKLEVLSGDLDSAQKSFQTVATLVPDRLTRALAHYNAYQAALQRADWPAALAELLRAVDIAPARYAPFPIERYQPEAILGAGGFGVAFRCRHRELNTPVVVKALLADQLASTIEDVFREAQVLDQLDHPCIIRLRECGYTDPAAKQRPYFLLNYFDGQTLEQHVRTLGPLPVTDVLRLGRLMAQGLAAAHARGILHRDVKPANVLVKKTGAAWQLKLIDFGLAVNQQALTRTHSIGADPTPGVFHRTIAGTLEYAPPEQLGRRAEPVGAYSDVYGLGKTLCYALFQTPNPGPRHWLGVKDRRLVELLGACLEENPIARPQSVADLLSRLDVPAAVPVVQLAPLPPRARPAETPVMLKPSKAAPPPIPHTDEPIVLQPLDLTGDLALYRAAVRAQGAKGERLFLEKHAARRQADWRAAARQGDAIGRFFVALARDLGIGLTRDLSAALERYRLAADAGLPEAQFALAQFYQAGRAVNQDYARAAQWYRKAAEQGHAAAQCKLARLYFEGQGVPRDDAQAFRWYHKAAEQGHAAAQHNLGELYATGRGVPRDPERAEYWYRRSAKTRKEE